MAKTADTKIKLIKTEEVVYEVGILALQGDFELHTQSLKKLGYDALLVKTENQLTQVKRLIIPGGESTTINKLIDLYKLRQPLLDFAKSKPVWGTCAGLIMLSMDANDRRINPLKLIDIDSSRNAYGRQVFSFTKAGELNLDGNSQKFEMVFIRAPRILRVGNAVEVLGTINGEPVMVRQNHILVSAFHPELTDSAIIHQYFMEM